MTDNLTDVIENSVSDATADLQEDAQDTSLEATTEPSGESDSAPEPPGSSSQVASPGAPAPAVDDEFAKKHGISAQSQFGRENRIPYSRVKKIVSNAEKALQDTYTADKTKWDTELGDAKAKVTDYEGRLTQVAEFERIMSQEPSKFLQMLGQLPAYREIFSQLAKSASGEAPPDPNAMPEPDQVLSDGSKVYSHDGLKALLDWQGKQVETRVAQRYSPIEQEWKAQKQIEDLRPVIQRQIDEARQWHMFNENEQAIVEALNGNPRLSLEGAYRQVVVPLLQTSQDQTRAKVLEELKRAPSSTSAPSGGSKPNQTKEGPRSIEQVIKDSIQHLKQ